MAAQVAMQSIAEDGAGARTVVFGLGLVNQEMEQSMQDSLTIIGPVALVLVPGLLSVAYRDPLDVVLGLVGVVVVLVWTFGVMGWTGAPFNQVMVAVPVLLIGLSTGFAIHVTMRYREERPEGESVDVPGTMLAALAGVGIALVQVAATTAIGFGATVTSPVGAIQDFGLVSAVRIVAALLTFGAFIPAIKIEIERLLERHGFDRAKRAFGTGDGRLDRLLETGARAAHGKPLAIVAVVLVLSVGGAAGATQVDTSFAREDFMAGDPPAWMDSLPAPFAPNEYSAKDNFEYVYGNFQSPDAQVEFLVNGSGVTDADVLEHLDTGERAAANASSVFVGPDGANVLSPLSVMETAAKLDPSFRSAFHSADTDGNGVPDRNVTGLYDRLFAVLPDRSERVVHRTDGEYDALRLRVSVIGTTPTSTVVHEINDVGHTIETASGDDLVVTESGDPFIGDAIKTRIFQTVVDSLIVSLLTVFGFLALL